MKNISIGLIGLSALGLSSLAALDGCAKASAASTNGRAIVGNAEVSVYKDDFAMVHELRPVDLTPGINHIRLGDVSRELDPSSVMFKPPTGTEVVSTTYDLGVGSNGALLQRLAGKQVELILESSTGHEGDRIKGRLEPSQDGGFLIRSGDKIYVNPKGTIVASADSDVATMPGLAVQVQSDKASKTALPISYLTRGMSWSADYVAHVDAEREKMDIDCWASVTNRTGIPYPDVFVTFVAGEPNRMVNGDVSANAFSGRMEAAKAVPQLSFHRTAAPIAVGDLYEYKTKGQATIGVDQISRVRMFTGQAIPIHLDYNIQLSTLTPWGYGESTPKANASLSIRFINKGGNGLGLPMPSGAVRVFQSDGESDRYTGGDSLPDLAKDSPADLTLGKVFDVSGESAVTKNRRVDRHTVRKSLRIILRNAKKYPVLLRVVQELSSAGKFVDGDRPVSVNASTYQWKISVPAGTNKTLEATFSLRD